MSSSDRERGEGFQLTTMSAVAVLSAVTNAAHGTRTTASD